MNKTQMIALYDRDERMAVEYPDMRRVGGPNIVRHINNGNTGEGMVSYSRLNATNVDNAIREQVRYFESIGQDFEWKVYDYDQPADLKERLRSYGFTVKDPEALLVLDIVNAAEILGQTVKHDVRPIIDPDELIAVQTVEEQVWNEDTSWVHDFLGGALRNYPQQMSIYVAFIAGQPASAAWIYFSNNGRFASLWGGATISGYRNQGLYTALLAVRAQEAKARQVRYLTVDASPMSRPILEKFGFEKIAYSYACKWKIKSPKQRVVT